MKKTFTLIELMVSLIIGLVLINFTFSYQFNFMNELKYLKEKENLSMYTFKATELVARGFKNGSTSSLGLVCLKEYTNINNIKINTIIGNKSMVVNKSTLVGELNKLKIDNYYLKSITASTFGIDKVEDDNGDNGNNLPWIYAIKMTLVKTEGLSKELFIKKPIYHKYERLVYTK